MRKRWVMHVDMDAFYAAVEQRDNPELKGKPVIVGGLSSRGVVATASYEARKFGVRSAMPISEAKKRCPQGIFLIPSPERYWAASQKIQKIFSMIIIPIQRLKLFLASILLIWMTL